MPAYQNDTPNYLKEYLDYIATIKLRSERTIGAYYSDIKQFLRFLKVKYKLVDNAVIFNEITIADLPAEIVKKVSMEDILDFLHFAMQEQSNAAAARTRKAVALRQFFKYLTNNKMWFITSPMQNLELTTPKNALPKHLTIEQATKLLITSANIKNFSDARDYCMLTFFLNCGMRLSELVGINTKSIKSSRDVASGEIFYSLTVLGKGNKERLVYLNSACVLAYDEYLKWRPEIPGENALFVSKQNKRISGRRVEQIIESLLTASELDGMGISVHKLRHTAATLMYQNGVDIRVLKEILGHKNLDTTQIYTHVADGQMQKAIAQNPLADTDYISSVKDNENK